MNRWLMTSVCALHVFFLALLLFSPRISVANRKHKPLAVRHLAPSPPVIEVKKAPPSPLAQAVVAKAATPRPTQKKASPQPQPQPRPAPKKQAAPQNSALAALAKELEKNIARMETKSTAVQKTARLQIDTADESDYVASLTRFLHAALHLPDFGSVKIQLTVRRDGTISKLLVLKTESEENRKYLEKQIPLLRFPTLQGEDEHEFVLTFCNEL